ncbi:MAG: DNA polymerase III subunit beta, partial [Cyanobacteria bacterium J06641_5]
MTTAKLTCQRNDLHAHLSLVSRAVSTRGNNYPILANVRLQTDAAAGQVTLTAFDLSLGLQSRFSAQCDVDSALTLPARLLGDIVARLPEGELVLEWEIEGDRVLAVLVSASGRFELRGLPADQFPELPEIDSEQATVCLPARALQEGLGATLFAASRDESKQVLAGVHLRHAEGRLEFAATDGHRLAVMQTSDTEGSPSEEFALTLPARALVELEKMLTLQGAEAPVTLRFDDVQVAFELGAMRSTARRVEGSYPAYQQLIPASFERQVTVER